MEIRQAQVYWLDFGPSAGLPPPDRHPCVVVQNDILVEFIGRLSSAAARAVRDGLHLPFEQL
jgi:mRNA-degrading endonuclease toxin of MazEF toxin-antitoxin module